MQVRQSSSTVTLNTIPFTPRTDGTLYELAIEIVGTTIIAYVDGREIGRGTKAEVSSLNGAYVTWQEAQVSGSETASPRVKWVSASS